MALHHRQLAKGFWVVLGTVSLITGTIGIFLPLLPTTPFLLLTAFCYARGSEKLHSWLLSHRQLGPPIHDWQKRRVIRLRTKIFVSFLMAGSLSFPLYFVPTVPIAARLVIGLFCGSVLLFIWMQKSGEG